MEDEEWNIKIPVNWLISRIPRWFSPNKMTFELQVAELYIIGYKYGQLAMLATGIGGAVHAEKSECILKDGWGTSIPHGAAFQETWILSE